MNPVCRPVPALPGSTPAWEQGHYLRFQGPEDPDSRSASTDPGPRPNVVNTGAKLSHKDLRQGSSLQTYAPHLSQGQTSPHRLRQKACLSARLALMHPSPRLHGARHQACTSGPRHRGQPDGIWCWVNPMNSGLGPSLQILNTYLSTRLATVYSGLRPVPVSDWPPWIQALGLHLQFQTAGPYLESNSRIASVDRGSKVTHTNITKQPI